MSLSICCTPLLCRSSDGSPDVTFCPITAPTAMSYRHNIFRFPLRSKRNKQGCGKFNGTKQGTGERKLFQCIASHYPMTVCGDTGGTGPLILKLGTKWK